MGPTRSMMHSTVVKTVLSEVCCDVEIWQILRFLVTEFIGKCARFRSVCTQSADSSVVSMCGCIVSVETGNENAAIASEDFIPLDRYVHQCFSLSCVIPYTIVVLFSML